MAFVKSVDAPKSPTFSLVIKDKEGNQPIRVSLFEKTSTKTKLKFYSGTVSFKDDNGMWQRGDDSFILFKNKENGFDVMYQESRDAKAKKIGSTQASTKIEGAYYGVGKTSEGTDVYLDIYKWEPYDKRMETINKVKAAKAAETKEE